MVTPNSQPIAPKEVDFQYAREDIYAEQSPLHGWLLLGSVGLGGAIAEIDPVAGVLVGGSTYLVGKLLLRISAHQQLAEFRNNPGQQGSGTVQ